MRVLQTVANALRGDKHSRQLGRERDADGETERRCCCGERAEPERPQ